MGIDINPFKREELLRDSLSTLGYKDKRFTLAEMDVIACIVCMQPNDNSKIASKLSLKQSGVNAHVLNIREKWNYISKNEIPDLVINKLKKTVEIETYYANLLVDCIFKKILKTIGEEINQKGVNCIIEGNISGKFLLLKNYLKLAKIYLTATTAHTLPSDNIDLKQIHILDSNAVFEPKGENNIILVFDPQARIDNQKNLLFNFAEEDNLYLLILKLISYILKPIDSDKFLEEFRREYRQIIKYLEGSNSTSPSKILQYLSNKTAYIIAIIMGLVLVYLLNYTFFHLKPDLNQENIRSELLIPEKEVLLERNNALTQIDKKLSGDDIQTVVIVGIAGSGKTTTVNQYAEKQNSYIAWKIDAETYDSLISSFEKLALSLCNDNADTAEFKIIQEMPQSTDRHSRLYNFITKKMRVNPNWLLIFDNVASFKDIELFYPFSSSNWGRGKIIIITRNGNIDKSVYINKADIIHIEELVSDEKLELFSKIINQSTKFQYTQEELRGFLKVIPPFPLDIALAAQYIKTTNISPSEYLRNIQEPDSSFTETQEDILKKVNYKHTRYDIISLSIQNLINKNSEYEKLILFISLLDSQNIPKTLLLQQQDNVLVTSLIRDLQKIGLITIDKNNHSTSATFSIHRAIQPIILKYLVKKLNLTENKKLLEPIVQTVETYVNLQIEDNDIDKVFGTHLESLCKHEVFSKLMSIRLATELGRYYFAIGKYNEAIHLLEESFNFYIENRGNNHLDVAKLLKYLGSTLIFTGDLNKAEKYFQQSLKIYNNQLGSDDDQTTSMLLNLGNINYENGDFLAAEKYYLQFMQVREKLYGPNHIKTVEALDLSSIDRRTGKWFKARKRLEHALAVYEFHYGKDHHESSKILRRLGQLYRDMGEFELAQQILEQALQIRINKYGHNHPFVAKILLELSHVYRNMGFAEKALNLLSNAYRIKKNYYGFNHFQSASVMVHLGSMCWLMQNYERAKELLENSVSIYEDKFGSTHINTLEAKMYLGDLYTSLHDYENAEKLLKPTYEIYKESYSKNLLEFAKITAFLGKVKVGLQQYKEANNLLNNALLIYQKQYGNDHVKSVWLLGDLANSYKYLGNFDKAEEVLNSALEIHKKNGNSYNTKVKELEIQLEKIALFRETRKNL